MATPTKKGSKTTKAKPPRGGVKTSPAKRGQTIAELRLELEARNRERTEAFEQQTATSEILRVIASSPTDIQPVLDVVAENAARLCDANDAQINRVEGDVLRHVARYGSIPVPAASSAISRRNPIGRAIVDRQTIHVHDLAAELEIEFPESKSIQPATGARTVLATPLLREGIPIGAIFYSSYGGAPLHPGANQAPRNLRGSGGDRD